MMTTRKVKESLVMHENTTIKSWFFVKYKKKKNSNDFFCSAIPRDKNQYNEQQRLCIHTTRLKHLYQQQQQQNKQGS